MWADFIAELLGRPKLRCPARASSPCSHRLCELKVIFKSLSLIFYKFMKIEQGDVGKQRGINCSSFLGSEHVAEKDLAGVNVHFPAT